jgi:uncharacterized membrane protein
MNFGPIELVIIGFPHNEYNGKILHELEELVNHHIIKIIDILLLKKDTNGDLKVLEMNDLEDSEYALFEPLVTDLTGLLNINDAQELSKTMPNDSSAGLMLFENTWATDLASAVSGAQGKVLFRERIPNAVIEEMATASAEVATEK